MKAYAHRFVIIVILSTLTVTGMKNCTTLSKPFELRNMGKGASSYLGCGLRPPLSRTSFEFRTWGLQYLPPWTGSGYGCQDLIVITYRKPNQPAMIWYRPGAKPGEPQMAAPDDYVNYKLTGRIHLLPCHKRKVPVQKVHVWKQRALFIHLITRVIKGIERIRAHDCGAPGQLNHEPNKTLSWADILYKVEKERVSTAALNFLQRVAFSNYICL